MSSETLSVPEEHLADVIKIIRAGIRAEAHQIPEVVRLELTDWCDEEERYLKESGRP